MNIIDAILNLVNNPITEIVKEYKSNNRANQTGDALELYVRDLFAGVLCAKDEPERNLKYAEVFSYLGNNNNPPDMMLRHGDAIEVKKIASKTSALALNSSHPKQKLKSSSNMIAAACRNAEIWTEKDMIYVVGYIKNNKLKSLCMVYGSEYCASEECYSNIKSRIKTGVLEIPGIDFSETNELGHVNRVDPPGITYLRVRGMWGIENPWKVFSYVYQEPVNSTFDFMCIIPGEKYETFENRFELEELAGDRLSIRRINVKDPVNPANLKDARIVTFFVGNK